MNTIKSFISCYDSSKKNLKISYFSAIIYIESERERSFKND